MAACLAAVMVVQLVDERVMMKVDSMEGLKVAN